MKKFSCVLFFSYDQVSLHNLIIEALNVLGFDPMVLYAKNDDDVIDSVYEESKVLSLIKNNFSVIQILNKEYDESDEYYWFRVSVDDLYNVLKLEWQNRNLDFLIKSDSMNYFLGRSDLIFGYCNEVGDRFAQSKTENTRVVGTDPNNPYKWETVEEKFDISSNWGRSINAGGLEFMAAPIMWFREPFYNIISKEKLLSFNYSPAIYKENIQLVEIQLFDLYDSPSKAANREKQKEFWIYFDLENVANKYKSENEIDPIESLKSFIQKARKKK